MNGKMTAAVLYGKEDVKIEKVPIPRLDDGEVLVKVQVALTCGTDLKVYQRGYHARMIAPPALFGHELAGVIEEVDRTAFPDHFRCPDPGFRAAHRFDDHVSATSGR